MIIIECDGCGSHTKGDPAKGFKVVHPTIIFESEPEWRIKNLHLCPGCLEHLMEAMDPKRWARAARQQPPATPFHGVSIEELKK